MDRMVTSDGHNIKKLFKVGNECCFSHTSSSPPAFSYVVTFVMFRLFPRHLSSDKNNTTMLSLISKDRSHKNVTAHKINLKRGLILTSASAVGLAKGFSRHPRRKFMSGIGKNSKSCAAKKTSLKVNARSQTAKEKLESIGSASQVEHTTIASPSQAEPNNSSWCRTRGGPHRQSVG